MAMELDTDEEELLNLSLAIVTTNPAQKNNRKRKASRALNVCKLQPFMVINEGYEGKIFKLLQVREEMLKFDQKKKGIINNVAVNEDGGGKGLRLIHLLLITATSVDGNDVSLALENLTELYRSVSLMGDSVQRVVAYFADGLAARLLTKKSPFYDMIMKEPTLEEEFSAFTCLYRVSPYYQFAHFTANQAIIEAFEKEEETNNRALHVIDFDVAYGFQWPSLIQSLSEKASRGNKISLRLTGYGRSLEELQETESKLVSFAKGFGDQIVFEFQGLLSGSKLINLRKKKNETVAVNLVLHLNTLKNNNFVKISDTLKMVHSFRPSVVLLVEQEGCQSPRSFLSRFMESLHYFAAMFDSLDDCLPMESCERLSIEKNHLGKEIKCMINCDNHYNHNHNHNHDNNNINININNEIHCGPRYEKIETWKSRMERHGFEGMKMSSKCWIQAKLLLKIRTHYCPLQCEGEVNGGGFRVFERDEGKGLALGWQDRCLLTASAWQCV